MVNSVSNDMLLDHFFSIKDGISNVSTETEEFKAEVFWHSIQLSVELSNQSIDPFQSEPDPDISLWKVLRFSMRTNTLE